MKTISVLRAGFLTTIQDQGRVGYRQGGVAVSGALDANALRVANMLVGNHLADAGLEVTLGKLRLRVTDDRLVAWCGGDFEVEVAGAPLSSGRIALVQRGEEMTMTAPAQGARAWLAISGGIAAPVVLGSRATDLRSTFGGLEGRALRDGDELDLGRQSSLSDRFARKLEVTGRAGWFAPNEWAQTSPRHDFLRVMRGAEWTRFEAASLDSFIQETFTVGPDSDRMGVRIDGPRLRQMPATEMISEAVAPGTIQVPPSGEPILLLGDCQTIGGYPKIAHVITVDLPAAAQLRAGDSVRFVEVTLPDAQRWLLERERDVERFRIGLALQTP